MSVTTLNTNASVSGKTLTVNENADTFSGVKSFNPGPAVAPFVVSQATATVVANLDADKVDGVHATALMKLDGTQAMTGKLSLGANGQIQFPAGQNPSADVNCLDDYEEGTFTPTIISAGGGTPTYSVQQGSYTKIGRHVYFHGRVTLATKGTLAAGAASITGLPFPCNATYFGSVNIPLWAITTNVYGVPAFVQISTGTIVLQKITAAGSPANLMDTDLSATSDFLFSGFYHV